MVMELMALYMLGKHLTTELHSESFAFGGRGTESHQVAQADFKQNLPASVSHVAEITDA